MAQSPFHNNVSKMAQQTLCPTQVPHSSRIGRTCLWDALIFSFQEGPVSAFMLPLRNQSLFLVFAESCGCCFPSLPVSISARCQLTRMPLSQTGMWVEWMVGILPQARSACVSKNVLESCLPSFLHTWSPGATSVSVSGASTVSLVHPKGAVPTVREETAPLQGM